MHIVKCEEFCYKYTIVIQTQLNSLIPEDDFEKYFIA